jgi:phage terminase large subunit-like protein
VNVATTTAPPRWATQTSLVDRAAGDGAEVAGFIEGLCRITKDTVAGRSGAPLVLRDWQHDLLQGLFARRADGRRKHRVGLIGLPRKNGKSALGSGIALHGLFMGPDGGEVYSCAADREQARIVFGVAKRMIELEPELGGLAKPYRDAIEIPSTGSVYRVLSSEAFTKEGLSPTLVVYDELHAAPDDELWNVMNLGSGARFDPLVLGITTAGVMSDRLGGDSTCYQLYQHGKRVASGEIDDPAFFFSWWEDDGDHRDPETWKRANPGYGDLIDPEDFASVVTRTPEYEFRTKRCNQFTATSDTWFTVGSFEACEAPRVVADGERVVLGFDGSYSGDSTGLVGCTLDGHLFVVDAWERPRDDPMWRVPIAEVSVALRAACRRYRVLEIACDPYRWAREIQELGDDGFPAVEFPQTPPRMVPACAAFYDAVMDGKLTHDGDPRLIRHVANSVVKRDRFGPRIVKDSKDSPRKIDLSVCAVMAYARAVSHRDEPVLMPLGAWR